MKKPTLLPLAALFLIAGLCLLGCEESSPAKKANYTVSFDLNGATGSIAPQTIAEGAKVSKPADPTRDGYTFDGWYTDEATTQEYNFDSPITANITLYAKWAADAVETFTVSFNSNEGSAVASRTVNKDAKVDKPTDPEKEGYTFVGWYTDEATTQEYNFDSPITANITLYAKWAAAVANGFLIPDVNFRTALKENIGDAFKGELMDTTHSSVRGLTALSVAEESISSLVGIKYFTALDTLDCHTNSLTELDVTQNTALTVLACNYNALTALDVTQNTDLDDLVCGDNTLTALDVTQNTALTSLYCENNELTALDVTKNMALTQLFCYNNSLTALDVTQNTALTGLWCYNNSLTALDVTKNTDLDDLVCGDNTLTTLDVTQNTALTQLDCRNSSLDALDVRQNTALTRLACQGNQLSSLDLRGQQRFTRLIINAGSTDDAGTATNPLTQLYVHTDLQTHDEVKEAKTNRSAAITISTYDDANTLVCADFAPNEGEAGTCLINKVLIPDVNFRTALKENISAAFDGEYMDTTHAGVLGLTALDVVEKSVSSLAGIEYFTALTSLSCNDNLLTELDITKNTALTSLNCNTNSLTALDVRQNTALTFLFCNSNELTELDVTQNTELAFLFCNSNELTALDVRQNTALTELFCNTNSLTALNVTQNTALTRLDCQINSLTELDVTKNTALTRLDCYENSLTALDVRQNTALTRLDCQINSLTELDVTKNTALTRLYCQNNELTVLDVTQNTALARLYCYNNSLTALDVRQNTALAQLLCQGNQLSSLDLRGRQSFTLLVIDAGSTDDAGTATNPLTQLYVHTDLQTHDEVEEAKTNRSTEVTISTYNDANTQVCADFDPTEGDAGTCKDTP